MKYIVFAYNIYTLSHAIKYANDVWGKRNTYIIYSDIGGALPAKIRDDYGIYYVKAKGITDTKDYKRFLLAALRALRLSRVFNSIVSQFDDDAVLVVFRDNEIEETTMYERALKKFGERIKFWIIEEGSGIYAKNKTLKNKVAIKRIIYNLLGTSTYTLKSLPQGLNPSISKIICSNPEVMSKKRNDVFIEQLIEVFDPQLNEYLIDSIITRDGDVKKCNYDFVFLTQPFYDMKINYETIHNNHVELLPKLFSLLSQYGKTIVKLHPRDKYEYEQFVSDRVVISNDEEKQLPVQVLLQYYGFPQMISMFSSASIGYTSEWPSIYLYKIFEIPGVDSLFSDEFYSKNNIIVCSSFRELEELIKR